jgi:ribonuclease J
MINLVKPKFLVPVHGEQRHCSKVVTLAESMGYDRESVFKMHPGDVLVTDGVDAWMDGRVTAGSVMVDGLGVGDVQDVVLRDRGHLAKDGVVIVVVGIDMNAKQIVSGPDVFSRGFVGEDYHEELLEEKIQVALAKVNEFIDTDALEDVDDIKAGIRKSLSKLIYERTHRRPMIVPIVMEV